MVVSHDAAPPSYAARNIAVPFEQTPCGIDNVTATDATDVRIADEMLFYPPAPIFMRHRIIISNQHHLAGHSFETCIESPHLAACIHLDNSKIGLGPPASQYLEALGIEVADHYYHLIWYSLLTIQTLQTALKVCGTSICWDQHT